MNEPASVQHAQESVARIIETATSIQFDFRRQGRFVSSVRRLVADLCRASFVDSDEIFQLAMATHELGENLAKYSSSASSSIQLRLHDDGERGVVRVVTRNAALPAQLASLREVLDRIAQAEDPVALYDDFIRESSCRAGSGLGLARICAETNLKLSYSIEGDEVTIVAEGPVPVRRNPS